jgi:hypothetical protein
MAADLDRQLAADLAAIPAGAARTSGVRLGVLTAKLMLAARSGDGSAAIPPPLTPGTEPGQYRSTPPAFAPAVFTHWPAVIPFVLDRADQFRPASYPALTSDTYARATNEVKRLGPDTNPPDPAATSRSWPDPHHRPRSQTPVQPGYPNPTQHRAPFALVLVAQTTPSPRPLVPPPRPSHMIRSTSTSEHIPALPARNRTPTTSAVPSSRSHPVDPAGSRSPFDPVTPPPPSPADGMCPASGSARPAGPSSSNTR